MKRCVIYIYGKDYAALSMAAEHAANMLKLGAPSEAVGYEDGTQVDYAVQDNMEQEYKDSFGDNENDE